MILDTKPQIELFRLTVLVSALRLETVGLKNRGRSAYSILKQELGIKGDKHSVLKQAQDILKTIKANALN